MPTVFIVDDHPVVRRGFADLISDEPDLEVCGQAGSVAEALAGVTGTKPDVVLLDLKLADRSGLDLIRQLRDRGNTTKVLVSSVQDEKLYAERVIRAGASGYIHKSSPNREIIRALRMVLKGKVYLSSAMTQRMLERLAGFDDENTDDPMALLSDRELQVFDLIGQGSRTGEIAENLAISPKTVESYRDSIKQKLGLNSGSELTRQAVQWVLERQE